ncbi:hypothetical protein RUM43_010851 [Polyplax serrata]|uniref:Secreted protein n=1 Tax=Polyplax serrata TaxID=468196 RepID=A0AAN8NL02_POLSC
MTVTLKLIIISSLLICTLDGFPMRKRTRYTTLPGQPPNIHFVVKQSENTAEQTACEGKLGLLPGTNTKCHTAEIIKVPPRSQNDCPNNQKKDAKGRCRPSWN